MLTLTLSPKLPDVGTYTIALGDPLTDLAGNPISGDRDRIISALRSDTNGDRMVNTADAGKVRLQLDKPITAANAKADVNCDGLINTADAGRVRLDLGHTAP